MASPSSSLSTSYGSVIASASGTQSTNTHGPTMPTTPTSEIQLRNTIIFGTFGTLIAVIGIIIAGAALRKMYKDHQVNGNGISNNVEAQDIELATGGLHGLSEDSVLEDADGFYETELGMLWPRADIYGAANSDQLSRPQDESEVRSDERHCTPWKRTIGGCKSSWSNVSLYAYV